MSATVSPHDANTEEGPGILKRALHTIWKGFTYPFNTDGELKWATGILSVDDDFETCALAITAIFFSCAAIQQSCISTNPTTFAVNNVNACLICMLPYISAKMVTDINDGFNVCSIPQEQISRVVS